MRKYVVALIVVLAFAVVLAGCSGKSAENDKNGTTAKEASTNMFELKTTAFEDGGQIPVKYANTVVAGGQNVSVPLSWTGEPDDTESFAVICVDTHPDADDWIHWLVKDIPANKSAIPEGASNTAQMPMNSIELMNTFGNNKYEGPQPPAGSGPHSYEFIVYALNTSDIDVPAAPTFAEFEEAIKSDTIAKAKVSGVFER